MSEAGAVSPCVSESKTMISASAQRCEAIRSMSCKAADVFEVISAILRGNLGSDFLREISKSPSLSSRDFSCLNASSSSPSPLGRMRVAIN